MAVALRKCVTAVYMLLMAMLPTKVAASKVLPPWEFHQCHLPSDPLEHPVATYQRKIINLDRMYNVAHTFRLIYYGSYHNKGCELRSGVLYYVQRFNKTIFTYNHLEDGKGVTSLCSGQRIWLKDESYGFVSCGEEHQATAAAWTWWSEVPLSYITVISLSVACSFILVTLVAIAVCLLRRRHVKGKASLPQVDMY
ncbi:uncharacterized protein LOC122252512 [Penaeus japonicus]|uniref:uncharacterized protein LOC122252512 n=1 Tax=Penaeus japonicus TaxID=27405 RepID=UPI001C70E529|nr:uncharacterized protein LOC122252512 [Penaeus japonicus]